MGAINISKTAKIFEIKRFAVHDGDGIRTTVFFKGCPLRCEWCHNPEGLSPHAELAYYAHKCITCGECARACPNGAHKKENGKHILDRALCTACGKCTEVCPVSALTLYGKEVTADELLPTLLEDKDFYENSSGGVTLSGGECLMQYEFCTELLRKLKDEGIHTAVDTCGYVKREALDSVIPYTDVFLYDVKAISTDIHEKCTKKPNEIIIENLKYLNEKGCKIEIRYPYVPSFNDCEAQKIAELVNSLENVTKVRVLPYHNYAGSKYDALGLTHTLPEKLPSDEEIKQAEALFDLCH